MLDGPVSALGEALQLGEHAVETAIPGAGWVKIALKLAPWIMIALLAAALGITRNTLHEVRHQDQLAEQVRKTEKAQAEAKFNADLAQAADAYAAKLAARAPLIVRSHDTVTQYAQTTAGRVPCLAPDRVRGIDEFDRDYSAAPDGRPSPVPYPAGSSPK